MRILGIDPGLAQTGYGLVDTADGELHLVCYGVISTDAADPTPIRLQTIYQAVQQLITEYEPGAAALEELFFGKNITSAIQVGKAVGVITLACAHAGLPVTEYSPAKIKDAVTGYGKADKAQVQLMVRNLLNLEETPRPDHAADSLAVALTHYQYARYEMMTAGGMSD
ncbi:MAG: crossover junction endodeoxyribonuclease RuvC [Anaerolineae bacterium]|nr:crossover junction endodeoxyribonuclease RuvC [Anaerolineae bacterium]